ncbi:MAG: aminotransferase class I/II-fold pyridoxal phosphate-dependent enzyme [Pleurocapsa minor GSE-CHR-MK-17-07R]|jgi:aspartate/methionine/tyrosine aminotransferase|nr:aminotransferase class I/II-fold pyridoxal phosphate-dependent enzyme [Pleurocapsa minor GSE-CHR-MK 17-07R]
MTTKDAILAQHAANTLLNAAAPPLTMRAEGDIGADEIFMPLDERIIAGASEAMEAGHTHYVDVPGIGPLRAAIAEYLRGATGADTQAANVIVTAGIQESRFLTIQMIGENFDRIALPAVVHPGARRALGVRPMPIETLACDEAAGYLPAVAEIQRALESGVRLVYLESPSRLTGAVYSAADTTAIAQLASQHQATIIWDQGLSPWAEQAVSLAGQSAPGAQIVTIGEAFPGMGLASWFIGYIAAPVALIPPMQSQKQIMAICTSTSAQYAALEASKLFGEQQPAQAARLQQTQAALRALLADSNSATALPGSTGTVLAVRAQGAASGADLADGADFGAPGVVRITVSFSSAAEAVVRQLTGKGS